MSYRNDHDAALARVDALTHELDRTEAERDHLRAEIDQLRNPPPPPIGNRGKGAVVVAVLAASFAVCASVLEHLGTPSARRSSPAAPEPPEAPPLKVLPPPAIAPAPPARAASTDRPDDDARMRTLATCVDRVQRAAADGARRDLRPLRASCRSELATVISHRAAPPAVTERLTRWQSLEDQLSPSLAAYNTYILRDPEGTHYRAPRALREAFDQALQARNAFLPEVQAALRGVEIGPRPDPLAHAIVEAPAPAVRK